MEQIDVSRNEVAEPIASSVTREARLHSYVASGGPHWLRSMLENEGGAWR